MNKTVRLRNVVLGEGLPKICVPIVGTSLEEIIQSAEQLLVHQPDVVEWRMDFYTDIKVNDAAKEAVGRIREIIGDTALLCTYRTKAEGGEQECSLQEYVAINEAVLKSGKADAIDVELFLGDEIVTKLVRDAHENGVSVIGSNHDFQKTPDQATIVSRLCRMQELGMDVAKMAVMPQDERDVLTLLEATREMKERHAKTPVITMSMGGRGMISRLTGEVFGAALTFGAVGKASAPGQIPVEELRDVLQLIHRYS